MSRHEIEKDEQPTTGDPQDMSANQPGTPRADGAEWLDSTSGGGQTANDGLLDIGVGDFEDPPDEPSETLDAEVDDADPETDERLAQLQAERDELQTKVMRVMADYQNLARRSRISIDEARQQQLMDVARVLLTPLDQFDHALGVDLDTTDAKDILQGVQIVRDELLKSLEQFGITQLQAQVGEPFDPNRHEALARQPVEGMEPDHIAAQLQIGYMIGDRVLRPAKVAITQ